MKRHLAICLFATGCVLQHQGSNAPQDPTYSDAPTPSSRRTEASLGIADPRLADLLEAHWDSLMQSSPLWASNLGDTRFHDSLGDWSLEAVKNERAKRRDFMTANTPLAVNNIENEVDRYITTPGQALAYKTGQRAILRMRSEAQSILRESFDIKGFHNAVLGQGAVSLEMIQEQVNDWVKSVQLE